VEPGNGRDRGIWASERVYRALIRLYPEEVRRRYSEEMVGYFRGLCRDEWHSRGAYLPVEPGTAARWGALSALLGGSLRVAYSLAYTLANLRSRLLLYCALGF